MSKPLQIECTKATVHSPNLFQVGLELAGGVNFGVWNWTPFAVAIVPENYRNYWAMHPRFDLFVEERLLVQSKTPRLRIVQKLLQFQIADRIMFRVGEANDALGHEISSGRGHITS